MKISKEYTPEEIQKEIDKINQMSRVEMAHARRFAPAGHRYFDRNLPFAEIFERRFSSLGGFLPEISKAIGWEP